MKIKIIIPAIVLLAVACNAKKSAPETKPETGRDTMVTVKPDSGNQQAALVNKDSAATDLKSVGELYLGMPHTEVTKLLGEPGKNQSRRSGAPTG